MVTSMVTALFASLLTPMLARRTVTHLPRLHPIVIGAAIAKVTTPVDAVACRTPTAADELCSSMVTIIPTATPRKGFANNVNTLLNSSDSAIGAKLFSMRVIPMKRMPRPMKMPVLSFNFWRFDISRMKALTTMRIGAKDDG